eukprot:comp16966_c0_seq1/m.15601 comp16966_c0_seq1/g.15601  ORF comp16966_c0_seq1/g.15601 comp16966_c0_seq1/m.15601 type:complete len:220 (-) comp16966_c0_seq1:164-823(-)
MITEAVTFVVTVVIAYLGYRQLFHVLSGSSSNSTPWTKPGTPEDIGDEDEMSPKQLKLRLEKAREHYEGLVERGVDQKELVKGCMRWAMAALPWYQYISQEVNDARKASRAGYIDGATAHQREQEFAAANEEMQAVAETAMGLKPKWEQSIFPEAHRMLQVEAQQRKNKDKEKEQEQAKILEAQQRAMAEKRSELAAKELLAEEEKKGKSPRKVSSGKK